MLVVSKLVFHIACLLLSICRPHLLDYDDCDATQPLVNLEKAFSLAENEFSVIRLLDPEGTCNTLLVIVNREDFAVKIILL